MDDAEIVINDECPEMQAGDFKNGTLRFNGRMPTRDEIEDGIRRVLNYLNRHR